MDPVVILSTGVANTASVSAAFRRCDVDAEVSDDPDRARSADRVVVPGVGSFQAGMDCLRASGLDEAIRDRVTEDRPLLAICLGLQLLCNESEESPGGRGLGLIDCGIRRLSDHVRSPQFGWNMVHAPEGTLVTSGYAYYANSYCLFDQPAGWRVSTTDHGGRFVASLERGPLLACQFHPELSGRWGSDLIERWLVRTKAGAAC